jgi:hypothetical protein
MQGWGLQQVQRRRLAPPAKSDIGPLLALVDPSGKIVCIHSARSPSMHCRCPHCHKAIEIVEEALLISGLFCPGASTVPGGLIPKRVMLQPP